jgi:hypothetical protein
MNMLTTIGILVNAIFAFPAILCIISKKLSAAFIFCVLTAVASAVLAIINIFISHGIFHYGFGIMWIVSTGIWIANAVQTEKLITNKN